MGEFRGTVHDFYSANELALQYLGYEGLVLFHVMAQIRSIQSDREHVH